MVDRKTTNTVYYGRPADKSFEAYRDFVRAMSKRLGIPKERRASDEKIRASWKRFWGDSLKS